MYRWIPLYIRILLLFHIYRGMSPSSYLSCIGGVSIYSLPWLLSILYRSWYIDLITYSPVFALKMRFTGLSIFLRVIIPLNSKYGRFLAIHAQNEGRSGVFILDRYIYWLENQFFRRINRWIYDSPPEPPKKGLSFTYVTTPLYRGGDPNPYFLLHMYYFEGFWGDRGRGCRESRPFWCYVSKMPVKNS